MITLLGFWMVMPALEDDKPAEPEPATTASG
jgi:hypothetical protein